MKKYALILPALALLGATAAIAADGPDKAARHKEHGERMFKKIDTNGDSVITKEESAAFHAKKFDEMDKNDDGKLSKDEIDAFHKERRDKWKAKHDKE